MMTYEDAISYIHSVSWQGSRPGLSRIRTLLQGLGNPQQKLRFIHIAGTNGKGSVSAMTESILRHAGYTTGLFVSPYIKHFNERIQYNGRPIDPDALAAITDEVRPVADAMEDTPTEFELITAIGLLYFQRVACEIVVLEVGMGGRLDSTNIIEDPLLTVITGIALDHTDILGDTVEKIAAEKAGIIKPGAPMLYGGEDAAAAAVIAAAARKAGVPYRAAADTPLTVHSMSLEGTVLSYGHTERVHLSLLGSYQPKNAATVLAAVELLRERGLAISEDAVRNGLSRTRWPGRFELLSRTPLILSDGAHNPQGIRAAADCLSTYFGSERVLLLCGVMKDKDHVRMVEVLAPHAEHVFTVRPNNPRALAAETLADEFRAVGISAEPFARVDEAVQAAVRLAADTRTPLVCLGSLYMYEEVTRSLEDMHIIDVR